MLKILVSGREWFDDDRQIFVSSNPYELHLEHSLLSISKWEAKWKIPFLDEKTKLTDEQYLDYIRCMTINPPKDPLVYANITAKDLNAIKDYVGENRTATKIYRKRKADPRAPKDRITAELIYYWMISYNIPFECQKWHLSQLMSLIDVCNFKSEKPEKIPKNQLLRERSAMNMARRSKHHSKG